MTIKPIKTKADYISALNRLDKIFNAKAGTSEGNELEVLGILIDNYEKSKFPIDYPDPIETIKFRMEQLGYNQNDFAKVVGLKSRASEILNRKRKLNLAMIRSIHKKLDIPTEVMVQNYKMHYR